MDSTTSAAHRRVGAAAVLAFLALLLLGVTRTSASADPVVPAATPTVQPEQPLPREPAPGFRHRDHDGFGGGRGFGGGGAPGGGGQTAPAPSTGGTKT
jgi:hypothetical protein